MLFPPLTFTEGSGGEERGKSLRNSFQRTKAGKQKLSYLLGWRTTQISSEQSKPPCFPTVTTPCLMSSRRHESLDCVSLEGVIQEQRLSSRHIWLRLQQAVIPSCHCRWSFFQGRLAFPLSAGDGCAWPLPLSSNCWLVWDNNPHLDQWTKAGKMAPIFEPFLWAFPCCLPRAYMRVHCLRAALKVSTENRLSCFSDTGSDSLIHLQPKTAHSHHPQSLW